MLRQSNKVEEHSALKNLSRVIDPTDAQAIREVVMALCPEVIYPEGGHGANITDLVVTKVKGGITNTLRRVARRQNGKLVCVCVCARAHTNLSLHRLDDYPEQTLTITTFVTTDITVNITPSPNEGRGRASAHLRGQGPHRQGQRVSHIRSTQHIPGGDGGYGGGSGDGVDGGGWWKWRWC